MWYLIFAILAVAAFSVFGLRNRIGPATLKSPLLNRMVDRAFIGSLTMDQVELLLERLETEEPPEPVMGAMCYEAMAYPLVAEYVCPVCGEKTVYSDTYTGFIEWEIPGCRRLAASINELTAFEMTLDESQFCEFCSDSTIEDPELFLQVASTDSTLTVNMISIGDLRMLEGFLSGELYYTTFNDGQQPLRDHADRIRELLGIPPAQ